MRVLGGGDLQGDLETNQVKARRGADDEIEDISDIDARRELYIAGFSSFVSGLAKDLALMDCIYK